MGERYERVEVALSRNTLYFLREKFGARKSFKTVVELAAKLVAGEAAEKYMETHGYKSAKGQAREDDHRD